MCVRCVSDVCQMDTFLSCESMLTSKPPYISFVLSVFFLFLLYLFVVVVRYTLFCLFCFFFLLLFVLFCFLASFLLLNA